MIIKAIAGGGGRGTRAVLSEAEIEPAWQRCRSEAEAAFGCGDVYVNNTFPALAISKCRSWAICRGP